MKVGRIAFPLDEYYSAGNNSEQTPLGGALNSVLQTIFAPVSGLPIAAQYAANVTPLPPAVNANGICNCLVGTPFIKPDGSCGCLNPNDTDTLEPIPVIKTTGGIKPIPVNNNVNPVNNGTTGNNLLDTVRQNPLAVAGVVLAVILLLRKK